MMNIVCLPTGYPWFFSWEIILPPQVVPAARVELLEAPLQSQSAGVWYGIVSQRRCDPPMNSKQVNSQVVSHYLPSFEAAGDSLRTTQLESPEPPVQMLMVEAAKMLTSL